MSTISTVEFMRHFGRYHDEAQKRPITLTKHGRPSVVVVPVDLFEKLKGQADPRRSYTTNEMPQDLADMFMEQLETDCASFKAASDE
ncbi:type II toxin-antitoxin system Phd/YefM family antitoxin [Castellaniella sp.]|uniref:type II toxin-antitoxin system Phd/YefM family antitoxin n=1 Tax=Castellaniella sp. TaxID=1955812 RepID=UPI002AFF019D|nr:type II toxin-antitoxin system Phd/YefM family antitoxin [Castellaniella sp.]